MAAIMVACDENGPLHFKHVCGFLELDLVGPAEISSIRLRGNAGEFLAGDICLVSDGSTPSIQGNSSSGEVLMRGVGAQPFSIPSSARILFSVVPQTFEKGVTYEIEYKSGNSQTVSVTSPVTVSRAAVASAHEAECRDCSVLDLCFISPSGEPHCPFKTEINRNRISAPVYLLEDSENLYPFRFYIQDISSADNLRITKSGLNIGGRTGDYLKFPGIEGKRLSRVDVALTAGKTGSAFCLCGPDGRRLSDDVSSNSGAAYSIPIMAAKDGESVTMLFQRDEHSFIHSIRLRYE